MTSIQIIEADLDRPDHGRTLVRLFASYVTEITGHDWPPTADVQRDLLSGLRSHPTTIVFLAYAGDAPVGLAICFRGFSTFAARPIINIHDLAVMPGHRGKGIGRRLLDAIAAKGRALGCRKLTLEVQENNAQAMRVYAAAGFAQAVYQSDDGGSLFLTRPL